jgi:hypothetical protein
MKPESITWNLREVADAIVMDAEDAIDPDTGVVADLSVEGMSLHGVEYEKLVGAAGSAARQLEAKAKIYKDESRHYRDKAAQLENAADKLKQAVKDEMERLELGKVDGPWGSAAIQQSTPAVQITGDVPGEYYKTPEPKLDKKKIADYIKSTGDVSFAELKRITYVRFR